MRRSNAAIAVQYRRVEPDDGPKLHEFWLSMSPQSKRTYCPYGPNSWLLQPWVESAERYALGPDFGLVATAPDGAVVGLGVVDRLADTERLPNFGLGVDDRYQGQGIGSRLMRLVLQEADSLGPPRLSLTVVNYNAPAQHLYKKLGFRVTGPLRHGEDGLTYLYMVRLRPGSGGESDVDETELPHRDWTVHVVPGSHFDLGWVAAPAECLTYGDEIIRSAIDAILGAQPGYRFTVEYSLFADHFLASYPEYLDRARELVAADKLEVCASVTGMMEQVLDGEAALRCVTYSQEWAERVLGRRLRAAQHSDLSGYTLQFPQILARSGVSYLAYSRFHPPIRLHWWQAPDGSRVLAANHPHHYGWGLTLRRGQGESKLPDQLASMDACWPVDDILMADEMDCLIGDPQIVEQAAQLQAIGIARFRMGTISQFFVAVEKADLPTYQGEAPYAIYSIHAANPATYREARLAENRLATGEKLSTLRELAGMGRYPYATLHRAWEDLFYPQDHNVGGRHGKLNAEVRQTRALSARVAADQVLQEGLTQLITHIPYSRRGEAVPVVVYNPLSWPRTDLVRTYLEVDGRGKNGLRAIDTEGKPIACQVLHAESSGDHERVDHARERRSWLDVELLATDVPPLGYRVYYLFPQEDGTASTRWQEPPHGAIEAAHFSLTLGEDGTLHSLVWKERGLDLVGRGEHEFNELVALEDLRYEVEVAHEAEVAGGSLGGDERKLNFTGKEWRSHLRVQRIEQGPVHTKVILEGTILDAPVVQEIILYDALARVDFVTRIDWRGTRHTQVRLAYPFNVPGGSMTYEVPFGAVRLGEDELPGSYDGPNRFVQKWIDLSNQDYGLTFSTRSGDHSLEGETISPIVLRSTYTEAEMDFWYENKGTFEFAFSVQPHQGGWKEGHTYRQGWAYNNPLLAASLCTCPPIDTIAGRAHLPEELSLCRVAGDNVVLTSISKQARGSSEYALRLFEMEGREGEIACRFCFPLRRVWRTNLLGDHLGELAVADSEVRLTVSPYEICQLVVEFAPPV